MKEEFYKAPKSNNAFEREFCFNPRAKERSGKQKGVKYGKQGTHKLKGTLMPQSVVVSPMM